MIRRIAIGIVVGLLIPALALTQAVLPNRRKLFQGSSSCTVASGNIINETFEANEYDLTWTETNNPDGNAAIPNSPCSGLGSQCIRANVTTSTSFAAHDLGAGTTADRYFRFYVYLDSTTMAVDDNVHIFHAQNTGGTRAFTVRWTNVTGVGYGFDMIGSNFSANIAGAALDTWFRVEVKWVNNATGQTELKIFNPSTGAQIGSTVTVNTANVQLQHLRIGVFSNPGSDNYDFYMDGLGVSSSGYLGQ